MGIHTDGRWGLDSESPRCLPSVPTPSPRTSAPSALPSPTPPRVRAPTPQPCRTRTPGAVVSPAAHGAESASATGPAAPAPCPRPRPQRSAVGRPSLPRRRAASAAPAGGHGLLVADVAPAPAAPGPPPALSQRAPRPARPQAPLCVRPPGHAWCPSGFPPLGSHGPFLEAADVPTGGPVCGFSHSLACHQDPLPSRAPLCPLWARASLPGASCP